MTVQPRPARPGDIDQLLSLWGCLFDQRPPLEDAWVGPAREWFATAVHEPATSTFPVIELAGAVVACAVGTLEIGVPNPYCLRGRTVRLANVVTLPQHRGQGFGTALVDAVVAWARDIDADRVDLSATPEGQRLYERAGFVVTSAPRMKLPLDQAGPAESPTRRSDARQASVAGKPRSRRSLPT